MVYKNNKPDFYMKIFIKNIKKNDKNIGKLYLKFVSSPEPKCQNREFKCTILDENCFKTVHGYSTPLPAYFTYLRKTEQLVETNARDQNVVKWRKRDN